MGIMETLENIPDWQKYSVVGLIVLALGLYFYYGLYKPNMQEMKRLDNKIASLDVKINKGLTMKGRLDEFRKEVYILQEKMRQAEEILGNKPAVNELLPTMESLATQAGLRPLRFDPAGERHRQFYGEIPINIEVSGRYHDLGRFFEKIANESRILNVTNLSINGTGTKAKQTGETVTASCILTAFWFLGGGG